MTERDSLERIVEGMKQIPVVHIYPYLIGAAIEQTQWAGFIARISALIPSKAEREFLEAAEYAMPHMPALSGIAFMRLRDTWAALLQERGKDADTTGRTD